MNEDAALFQKGLPIRREVLGPEYVDASMEKADAFMMAFQRATTAWAWGWAWGNDTLDRKARSLLNLAMLTASGHTNELKLHVKGALNNGVSVDEIKATHAACDRLFGHPARAQCVQGRGAGGRRGVEVSEPLKHVRCEKAATIRDPESAILPDIGIKR